MDTPLEHDTHAHPNHQRRLAQAVMHRQMSLSLKIAAIFLVMLFGLPLINYLLPELANTPVFGFTATWLFLAVLFYPITWILSWWFIQKSNDIEADIAATMRHESGTGIQPVNDDSASNTTANTKEDAHS